jgi:hypothetical protein
MRRFNSALRQRDRGIVLDGHVFEIFELVDWSGNNPL